MTKYKNDKVISYASRLLNVRPRSEKELADRLSGKGFNRVTVASVISILREKKIIDDFKFAKFWVQSRMHTRPEGDLLLKKELKSKGISMAIIEKVLSEKEEKEIFVVKSLAKQYLKKVKKLPKEKSKKKMFDFLARRGFDFDVIKEAIEKILGS